MKKRIIPLILTVLCVLTLITGAVLAQQQRTLADKLIRLHVVANSDSQYDQMVKLRVRDAVLDETQRWLSGADDPAAALAEHLGEIEAAAGQTLRACGSGEAVSVRLQNELFSRRDYETFSLPVRRVPHAARDYRRWRGAQLVVRRVPGTVHECEQ